MLRKIMTSFQLLYRAYMPTCALSALTAYAFIISLMLGVLMVAVDALFIALIVYLHQRQIATQQIRSGLSWLDHLD